MSNGKKPSIEERLQQLGSGPVSESDAPAPDDRQSGWLPDPWRHVVETAGPVLDKAGVFGKPEGWLRQAGAALMPRTAPELAMDALMVAQPEGLIPKAGATLAKSGVLPALSRAALRGVAVGGIGKATGYDPVKTAALAAAGSGLGELGGLIPSKLAQRLGTQRSLDKVTDQLARAFRATIGEWLPKGGDVSAERIIRAVAGDEPSAAISAAINELKAAQRDAPVSVIDLRPQFSASGVTWEAPTAQAGTAWPPVREFERRLPGPGVGPGQAIIKYERPLGDLVSQIDRTRARILSDLSDARRSRDTQAVGLLGKQLDALGDLETTVLSRADPRMQNLLHEYGRAKQLTELFRGESDDPATWAKGIFEGRTGRLSWEGYTRVNQRLGLNTRNMRGFRPDELDRFGDALRMDLREGGMVTGQEGEGVVKSVGIYPRVGIPMPHARLGAPRTGWIPNWEEEVGAGRRLLAPAAVRAILGQGPIKFAPPAEQETP